MTKESIIKMTYYSENLPPAFAEAASRRQVAPLCQRGVIPPFCNGMGGGIWDVVFRCSLNKIKNWGMDRKDGLQLRRRLMMGILRNCTPSSLRMISSSVVAVPLIFFLSASP